MTGMRQPLRHLRPLGGAARAGVRVPAIGRLRRGCAAFASAAASESGAPAATSASSTASWEVVVGVETHVQLDTASKAFCACPNTRGGEPNRHVCPVCLGHPGALPVLNRRSVELAIQTGLALNCTIHRESKFDRKQYFYGDLPKGYQISQNDRPVATDGFVEIDAAPADGDASGRDVVRVGIERLHMEEDTAKLTHGASSLAQAQAHATDASLDDASEQHGGGAATLADFNRAGAPLVEIVTRPDLRSGAEAAAYAAELRRIVRFLGASTGDMQDGALRCDVNVSVRKQGTQALNTKVGMARLRACVRACAFVGAGR